MVRPRAAGVPKKNAMSIKKPAERRLTICGKKAKNAFNRM